MRNDELLVRRGPRYREELGELGETKRGDDAHDVCVVCEIKVEGLIEGEGRR